MNRRLAEAMRKKKRTQEEGRGRSWQTARLLLSGMAKMTRALSSMKGKKAKIEIKFQIKTKHLGD